MTDTPEALRLAELLSADPTESPVSLAAAAILRRIPELKAQAENYERAYLEAMNSLKQVAAERDRNHAEHGTDYQLLMNKHNALHFNALVLSQRVAELEAKNEELERLCDATYVAEGADAYHHACSEMERWQKTRIDAGKDAGTEGSLCDGIAWLYGHIEQLEAERDQLSAALSATQPAQAAQGESDDSEDQWRDVALRFDRHRMQALWHLQAMLRDPEKHADVVRQFLRDPTHPDVQPAVAQGAGEVVADLKRLASVLQELNLNNYGPDDVDELNAWAIEVSQAIDQLAPTQPAAGADVLDAIDVKAEAGLCQMTLDGARAFLKEIRAAIAASGRGA